jgi:hypothetical protein
MGSACSAWLWLSPECAACALLRSEVSVTMLLSKHGEREDQFRGLSDSNQVQGLPEVTLKCGDSESSVSTPKNYTPFAGTARKSICKVLTRPPRGGWGRS